MPNLACQICGRVVYTAAALDSLFAEERRCPRCGGMLFVERRVDNRRKRERRQNRADVPGPPGSFAAASEPAGHVRVANVVAGCAAAATLVLGVAGGAVLDIVTGTLAR